MCPRLPERTNLHPTHILIVSTTWEDAAVRKFARNIFFIPRAVRFACDHAMLLIAAHVAIVTMIAVPPDAAYLGYFDWNTLGCLFSVLAVANAFRFAGAFDRLARLAIERLSSPMSVIMTLVATTGALSIIATNDLALIIMLPITLFALVKAGWSQLIAPVFVLEGLAANLCGMIMPFGNPQNLYLYSFFHLSLFDFLQAMGLPFLISTALVLVCTYITVKRSGVQPMHARSMDNQSSDAQSSDTHPAGMQPAGTDATNKQPLNRGRLILYAVLLILALLAVFRIVPVALVVVVILVTLLALDRPALKAVDYSLLLTFVCFFIFAGNMARMPFLADLFQGFMDGDGLIASALLSQVISNVPAAVLFSHFTSDWSALLVGVNVGGAGTLIASLASLITLRMYTSARHIFPDIAQGHTLSTGRFLKIFTLLNVGFLVVLLLACKLCGV